MAGRGAVEVCRHRLSTPGSPQINDEHYPVRPPGPLNRTAQPDPRATNAVEESFIRLGSGATTWLIGAGATRAGRVKKKTADAVQLAALHGTDRVDWAVGHVAVFGHSAKATCRRSCKHTHPGTSSERLTPTRSKKEQRHGTGSANDR